VSEQINGDLPASPKHEIAAAINALGEKYEAAQKGRPEPAASRTFIPPTSMDCRVKPGNDD